MDAQTADRFKTQLERMREQLQRSLATHVEETMNATTTGGPAEDIAGRATETYQKEFLLTEENNERQTLGLVQMALDRIQNGDFGQCIHCGREIPLKRLEAVPYTRFCLEDQEKMERGELPQDTRAWGAPGSGEPKFAGDES